MTLNFNIDYQSVSGLFAIKFHFKRILYKKRPRYHQMGRTARGCIVVKIMQKLSKNDYFCITIAILSQNENNKRIGLDRKQGHER